MTAPAKILILGSAHGLLPTYISKLRTFHTKHGPFDAIFCLGDFFAPPTFGGAIDNEGLADLLEGRMDLPAPTFVLNSPAVPLPESVRLRMQGEDGEVCTNLVVLNGVGQLTLPGTGVHVAYSSNTTPLDASALDPPSTTHLLLTHSHPSLVFPALPGTSSAENDADLLLKHHMPRYAFSGASGVWAEVGPFGWPIEGKGEGQGQEEWTRCVSLGSVRGEGGKKQRFYYAFTLNPLQPPPPPVNAIPNPYLPSPAAAPAPSKPANGKPPAEPTGPASANKRKFEAIAAAESAGVDFRWGGEGKRPRKEGRGKEMTGKPPDGYRCKVCDSADHYIQNCPEKAAQDSARTAARETDGPPPEGYTCHKCGVAGDHFVRNCPKKGEVGDTGGALPPEGYVCRACGGGKHYFKDCEVAAGGRRKGGVGRGKKEIGPDECWFCLSNPNITKHLITSIGSETYVTLPRGSLLPLSPASPRATHVPGGGHVLIIPITHHATLLSLPPALLLPITAELESYKSSLRAFFRAHGCAPVSWEIARLSARGHAHLQIVPVPLALAEAGAVERAFREEGERGGVDWEEETPGEAGREREGDYVRVELPGGKVLVHNIRPGPPFNLQFPRMVLGKLLGLDDRIDWKSCPETEEDEQEAAEAFKAAFAEYDPTLA